MLGLYLPVVSLKIRLSRVGAKKQASYRIVVADSTAPRDGKAIAIIGHYNPLTDPYTLKVDEAKAVGWLRNGAQPSETARGLLVKAGVIAAYEQARKTEAPARKKSTAGSDEETKARRAARAQRTEPPRLVRPVKPSTPERQEEGAVAVSSPKPATSKTAARGKAGAKSGAKGSRTSASRKTGSRSRD